MVITKWGIWLRLRGSPSILAIYLRCGILITLTNSRCRNGYSAPFGLRSLLGNFRRKLSKYSHDLFGELFNCSMQMSPPPPAQNCPWKPPDVVGLSAGEHIPRRRLQCQGLHQIIDRVRSAAFIDTHMARVTCSASQQHTPRAKIQVWSRSYYIASRPTLLHTVSTHYVMRVAWLPPRFVSRALQQMNQNITCDEVEVVNTATWQHCVPPA